MTCDEIEIYIDNVYLKLDKKIQDRFVYCFDRGDGIHDNMVHFADCARMFNPPVITFYTKVLEKINALPHNLDGMINHEIIHTFGFGEAVANEKEDTINFKKK